MTTIFISSLFKSFQQVMKPLLDLSVGLDRAQSPHQYLLKSNIQLSSVDQITDDSHIMHYYGNNYFYNLSIYNFVFTKLKFK